MKKLLFILSVGLVLATLSTSCEKAYTCHCEGDFQGQDFDEKVVFDNTKSDAKEYCDSREYYYNGFDNVSIQCEIE